MFTDSELVIREIMSREIRIEVAGGCCRLSFLPWTSTGPEADTNPGVGFTFISETPRLIAGKDGKFYGGMGVIGRRDARLLMDMIATFLATEYPESKNDI